MFKMTSKDWFKAAEFLRTDIGMKHEDLSYLDGYSLIALANIEWKKLHG